MIKNQIEINANLKSTAASWLGVDFAALKTDKNADLDDIQQNECLLNSKYVYLLERLPPVFTCLSPASSPMLHVLIVRKEMFYLTMHSTHFIYGYMASVVW